jgi:hypothetical protein
LNGATPQQALTYIQSFALTPYSSKELLRILNNSSIDKSQAYSAIPFVQAYKAKGTEGADKFLQSILRKDTGGVTKMEIDIDKPALFTKISDPPSIFSHQVEVDEGKMMSSPTKYKFNDVPSVARFLEQTLNNPASKEKSFVLTSDWLALLKALKTNVELTRSSLNFAHQKLAQLHKEMPSVLYSLLMSIMENAKVGAFLG